MNDIGFIKVHRKIIEWEWVTDPYIFRLFIILCAMANYKDGQFLGMVVKRGQLVTSALKLADLLGSDRKSVMRCLKTLEQSGEIKIEKYPKFNIITICKYEEYQNGAVSCPSSSPFNGHQHGHQHGHNQRSKEYNNSLAKEREFVSPSLDEIEEYARERHAEDIAIDFYEHYESNGWMVGNNRMRNWKASFNAWVRRKQKESSYDDDVQMNIQ